MKPTRAKSIWRQQAAILIVGALGLYIVCAIVIYRSAQQTLYREFDATLSTKAASLASLLGEDEDAVIELNFSEEVMPEFSASASPDYFQVWLYDEAFADNWRLLERSESMGSARFPRRHGSAHAPLIWNLDLPDGRPGRAAGAEYALDVEDLRRVDDDHDSEDGEEDETQAAIVVVARGRESVRQTLGAVLVGLLVAGAVLGAAIVPLVTWSVHRSMRPVRELGRHVGGLGASELGQPIDATALPVELQPIVTGLNRLLRRLDDAFERERRTTANIAHELRTPIAELRAATDVATRWQEDDELARNAVRAARGVALQMEGVVEALLRLSRVESGQLAARDEAVPLRSLIDEEWRRLAGEADARRLSLDSTIPDDLIVRCDRDALTLVTRNLLANAVGHAPAGDRVDVRVDTGDDDCTVRMSNENTTLEAAEIDRIAEAFWTKDTARADREHVGLGLAMVSAVGRAAGLPVDFALESGRFVAALRLRLEQPVDDRSPTSNGTTKGSQNDTLEPDRTHGRALDRRRRHARDRG